MRRSGCLLFFLLAILLCHSQDISNKGKDFWITYPAHVDTTKSVMGLYITSDQAASGTVQVGATSIIFSITPNTVKTIFIGPGGDVANTAVYLNKTDGITANAGIHVVSDRPVVVYAHIIFQYRSGASLILPSNVWGREYIVPSYGTNTVFSQNSGRGGISIIAKEANTVVEINPKTSTLSGRPAGTSFSITLANPGDIYQVQFTNNTDISGTTVQSVSQNNTSCKPIAVFSSTTWSAFDCPGASGGDNLYQQLFPVRAFGKKYLTAPFINRKEDIIRVFVSDPATVVTRSENGVITTLSGLQANGFYEIKTKEPNLFEADKPVSVVQYITSQSCTPGALDGDPEMVILNPIEQTVNNITVFSAHKNFVPTGQSSVNSCFLNIVIKTAAAPSFRINGNMPSGSFTAIPGTGYSYLQQNITALALTNPVQVLKADSNFSAIAYGYGDRESYGYNAGTNVRDLYQYITIKNPRATINYPASCVNTVFQPGITLPYKATKLTWTFYGKFADTIINNPVPDSSFLLDGKILYHFSLGKNYSFSGIGNFPLTVFAYNPGSDGCSGEQQIDFDFEVYDKPRAKFTFSNAGCVLAQVQFRDSSFTSGGTVNSWLWDFGDNTKDSVKYPVKAFSVNGSFSVKETITTDIGCFADTTAIVKISEPPIANFNIAPPYCVASTIIFKDVSTVSSGSIVNWFWDYGNGKKDTLITNSGAKATYNQAKSITVSLVVEASGGCRSLPVSKTFIVSETPLADFELPAFICLPSGVAQFTNHSDISAPDILTYNWDFGDGGTDIATNPYHKYTSAGPFNIRLTATSSAGCRADTSKQFSEVYAQPKADFIAPVTVCLGSSSRFYDTSAIAGLKYGWDLGNNTTDTTKEVAVIYTDSGTYKIRHWVVNTRGCTSDTVVKNITVNPLPTAVFNTSIATCQGQKITFTDESIANAGTLNRWQWNFGDGSKRDTANGNPFEHVYDSAGAKTVELLVSSATGCISVILTKTIDIQVSPIVAFSTPVVCQLDAFAQFYDRSSIPNGNNSQFIYGWNFGDANANAGNPNTSAEKDAKHRFSVAGNYTITLNVTSGEGCTTTTSKPFTVNGDKIKAGFTIVNSNSCSNGVIKITDQSTVNIGKIIKTEIYWDWPSTVEKTIDSVPLPGKTYQHVYPVFQTPASKTFNIRLLSYSGGACVNEVIKSVTLSAAPKVIFAGVPGFCVNAVARQITQASTLGNLAGQGTFSGTGISATGLFDPKLAGVGSHLVKYIFVSANGCIDSASQAINVWQAPVADFSMSPACISIPTTFTSKSTTTTGKIVNWTWSFGDGTSQIKTDSSPVQRTYPNTGSFEVQLQVKTDSGCTSPIIMKTIDVNALPQVDFDVPALCINTPAKFTDKSSIADGSGAQLKYLWDFGAGISVQKDPVFAYNSVAAYNVRLQVTSKDGCTSTLTKPVTDLSPQPLANFNFSPGAVCLGQAVTFTDQSNPLNQTVNSWAWNFDDGTNSTMQQNTHLYNESKDYTVSFYYITTKGCYSDTVKKIITVDALPIVNAGPDQYILTGGQKLLQATVTGSANYQYRWSPPAGLNNPSILQPIASPSGNVTYTLTVIAAGGCEASDQVFVQFVEAPVIPNAFSPNGDGINDVWNIKYLDSYQGSTITVFDRYGRQVYAGNGSSKPWDGSMKGKPLPIGIYYFVVDPKTGKIPITGSLTILR